MRLYIDGVLDASAIASGALNYSKESVNVRAEYRDGVRYVSSRLQRNAPERRRLRLGAECGTHRPIIGLPDPGRVAGPLIGRDEVSASAPRGNACGRASLGGCEGYQQSVWGARVRVNPNAELVSSRPARTRLRRTTVNAAKSSTSASTARRARICRSKRASRRFRPTGYQTGVGASASTTVPRT